MRNFHSALLAVLLSLTFGNVQAFWRMRCGTVQVGRVDPIISPGGVAGHSHTIAGPNSKLSTGITHPNSADDKQTSTPPRLSTIFRRLSAPHAKSNPTRALTGPLACTTGTATGHSSRFPTMVLSLTTWIAVSIYPT